MNNSIKCQSTFVTIPPFRVIKGRKYKYPTNERDWVRECKRALNHKRRTYAALCARRRPPPPNFYFNNLLRSPEQIRKGELRAEHRAELVRRGVIKEDSPLEVHHMNGVYDLNHAVPMTHARHVAVHAKKRRESR